MEQWFSDFKNRVPPNETGNAIMTSSGETIAEEYQVHQLISDWSVFQPISVADFQVSDLG